jgi:hypothetical protein
MLAHPERAAGPSGSGTVVLELGSGAGALVLHTPAELNGAEIEISSTGSGGRRTHSQVRPRRVPGGTQYAAVYPDLLPGDYVVWRDHGTPALTVTVTAASATVARLADP